MHRNTTTLAAGLVAIIAGAAMAQPIYLATSGSTLFRAEQGGSATTFALSDDITNLLVAPNGDILAFSSTANGSGNFEVYRLIGALGNSPSLQLVSDNLTNSYPAATFVGDTLYAYRNGSRNLVTYDIATGVETEIGPSAPMQGPVGGAAYDAATDTFYAVTRGDDSLFTVDYAPAFDPDATLVGNLGIDVFNMGLEMYQGALYGAFEDTTNGRFVAGTINTGTGAFTPDTVLFDGALDGAVGFVVVPAPGALAVLAAGGLVAVRRRR